MNEKAWKTLVLEATLKVWTSQLRWHQHGAGQIWANCKTWVQSPGWTMLKPTLPLGFSVSASINCSNYFSLYYWVLFFAADIILTETIHSECVVKNEECQSWISFINFNSTETRSNVPVHSFIKTNKKDIEIIYGPSKVRISRGF